MKCFYYLFPLAALALPSAQAAVIYSGTRNIVIPFNFDGVYINLLTNAVSTSEPVDFIGSPTLNFAFSGVDISHGGNVSPVVVSADQAFNVPIGLSIGSGSNFVSGPSASSFHIGPAPDQFRIGTAGYVGFSMTPGGGPAQYGWVKVELNNTSTGGKIVSYAYESTPGVPIAAGAIPEPSTFVTLGAGGLALLLRRRRLGSL